jgi:hypothetical protein
MSGRWPVVRVIIVSNGLRTKLVMVIGSYHLWASDLLLSMDVFGDLQIACVPMSF